MKIKDVRKRVVFFESIKWVSVILLIIIAVVGNNMYHNYDSFIRIPIIFFILMIAMYVFFITKLGKFIIVFGSEACIELRKVTWPTYRDGLNTTLIVTAVTIAMSLVLWGLDTVLVNLVSFGLRL